MLVVQKINGNLILNSPHLSFNARVENVWSSPAVECLGGMTLFQHASLQVNFFFLEECFSQVTDFCK